MKYIVILSLFCFLFIHAKSNKPKTCDGRLSRFSSRNGLFIQCILKELIPPSYCTSCVKEHKDIREQYEDFMNGIDTKTNRRCQEVYKDDLHVIKTVYNNSEELWKSLKCDECLANVNGTKEFMRDFNNFEACLNKSINVSTDPCIECKMNYTKIMDVYDGLKKESSNRICAQIEDYYYYLKTLWSQKYSCNKKPKGNLLTFTILSFVFMFLPGVFYGGAYKLSNISQDTNSNDSNGEQIRSESVENGFSNHNTPIENKPSTSCSAITKKFTNADVLEDEYDDDDDESILPLPKKKQDLIIFEKESAIPPKNEEKTCSRFEKLKGEF